MKFSKVSLQERIEQNERELNKLKSMSDDFKIKYYELNNNACNLLEKYNLEKMENDTLKAENESIKTENEKLKVIIEGLIEECETMLNNTKLKDKVSKIYTESLLHYANSTLGIVYKK
jgi:hypothetical protein